MYKLTAIQGEILDGNGALSAGDNLVGRSRSCAVRVGAPDVSGKHCKVVLTGDTVAVENLSQNGSRLDNEPLEFITLIEVGQIIHIGDSTSLRLDQVVAENGGSSSVSTETENAGSSAVSTETPAASDATPASEAPPTTGAATDATQPPDPEQLSADTEAGPSVSEPTIPSEALAPSVSPQETEPAPEPLAPEPPAPPEEAVEEELATGDPGLEQTAVPEEPPTRMAEATAPPRPSPPPTVAPEDDEEEVKTQDYEEAATRALETRALRPEDLAALREAERARPRRHMMMLGGGIIALLVAAFIFWPKAPPPETDVKWPKDAKGAYLDAHIHGSLGAENEGGFTITFPGTPGWKKKDTPLGFLLHTQIGRDRDIPLIFELEEEEDRRFVEMDLEQAAADWVKSKLDNQAGWTFDDPQPFTFLGKDSGIPYLTLSYSFSGSGSWYGNVRIFQIGARRFALRSDIPYTDRARASGMVELSYIQVSKALQNRYWAGRSEQSSLSAKELVRRIRPELDRMAPATWVGIQENLQRACRKAYLSGDRESLADAEAMLIRLRESQTLWFNAQKIARLQALRQKDDVQVRQIADLCKGVFSSMSDYRYLVVRREKW